MFNTTILDVAIGMLFVYLLLSLICTAANEIIELMLKKRAIDLERGIRELLIPGSNSGSPDIVQDLYNHPLINNLYGGQYQDSRIATRRRRVIRTMLPSYIPARNFSLALMDLIQPGVPAAGAAGGPSGASGATAPSPAPLSPAQVVVNVAGGAAPAVGAPPVVVPPPPPVPNPSLIALRAAILANPQVTDHIKGGLVPLLDAAGNDMGRVRENIEGWYNASMDRVSSWYKRRAQVTTLILGLFIAITVNADSIKIAKRLSTDRPLRESLVAAAQDYAKVNASASPSGSPSASSSPSPSTSPAASSSASSSAASSALPSASPSPSHTPLPNSSGQEKVSPTATQVPTACVNDANSAECEHEKKLLKIPACVKDRNSLRCKFEEKCGDKKDPECRYQASLLDLQSLSLPIGWDSEDDIERQWPGWRFQGYGGWWDQIYWHLIGWLLTALAISLGAPFWFDLLNKFIVIRSAVKPHEKSPEEGSKD